MLPNDRIHRAAVPRTWLRFLLQERRTRTCLVMHVAGFVSAPHMGRDGAEGIKANGIGGAVTGGTFVSTCLFKNTAPLHFDKRNSDSLWNQPPRPLPGL